MTYSFALLTPSRAPDAEALNAPWLGPGTLGVEVTEPALAACCGLGNIDPQHSPDALAPRAAIEAALAHPLPPPGARLVTVRRDVDACGAMAVLCLRARGVRLSPEALERAALAAQADAFRFGAWPGRRALPLSAAEIDEVGVGVQSLGAMIGGVAGADIGEGVAAMEIWLTEGRAPEPWLRQAEQAAQALWRALADGAVRVRLDEDTRIAVVEGFAPGALRLGYRLAPVVVAASTMNRASKYAIAQFAPGSIDMRAIKDSFAAREPGWGGSATLLGSPQGVGSALDLSTCLALTRAALI